VAVFGGNSQGSLSEGKRLGTVDLLVLTSLDQLVFILKMFSFVTKQATLMRRSTVLSIPPQLVADIFITGLVFLSQVQI
jgi:hypothetical protein